MTDDQNKFIYQHIKKLQNMEKTSSDNGWLSDVQTSYNKYNCVLDKSLKTLHNKVTQCVNKFADTFNAKFKMVCKYSWFNCYSNNDYQETHTHPNSHFSAVYFVKSDKKSSPFVLMNMKANAFRFATTEVNSNTFEYANYEPLDNRLLIFESYIRHQVPKNKTNERITMSFNYLQEKK